MDLILSYIVRLKILLVGYNGARNTGACLFKPPCSHPVRGVEAMAPPTYCVLRASTASQRYLSTQCCAWQLQWYKPMDGMVSLMIKLADVEQGDATILPQALGLPPMLTIMALAKRIANIISKG